MDPDFPEKNYDHTKLVSEVAAYIRKRLPYVDDKPSLIEYCFFTVSTNYMYITPLVLLTAPFVKDTRVNMSKIGNFGLSRTTGRNSFQTFTFLLTKYTGIYA